MWRAVITLISKRKCCPQAFITSVYRTAPYSRCAQCSRCVRPDPLTAGVFCPATMLQSSSFSYLCCMTGKVRKLIHSIGAIILLGVFCLYITPRDYMHHFAGHEDTVDE